MVRHIPPGEGDKDRKGDTMATKRVSMDVLGMTCAACSARIEKSLAKVEGVQAVNVNLSTNKAVISFDDSRTDGGTLVATIEKTGYKVPEEKRVLLVEGMT